MKRFIYTLLFFVPFFSLAQITPQQKDQWKGVATGQNSYSVTLVPGNNMPIAPYQMEQICVTYTITNTGASTLKVNNFTAYPITLNGSALAAGDIIANQPVVMIYDDINLKWCLIKSGVASNTGQSIATAATTTTLTATSPKYTFFTGSTTQTVQLPVTSTLPLYSQFQINNTSTQLITVNSSGGNLVGTIYPNSLSIFQTINTGHTTAVDWAVSSKISNNQFMYKALITAATFTANIATSNLQLLSGAGSNKAYAIQPGEVYIRCTGGTTNYTFAVDSSMSVTTSNNTTEVLHFVNNGLVLSGTIKSIPIYDTSGIPGIGADVRMTTNQAPLSGNRNIIISFIYYLIDLN